MPRLGAQREERAAALASLAANQHGIVEYDQLLRLGFTRREVNGMVTQRRLHRIHRGVYQVGHSRLTGEGRYMAAVLACGPGAVLSHWSAAALWGLLRPREPVVTVWAPRHRRGRKSVKVHWTLELDPRDATIRDGIPVTTVPRTVLDLAALGDERMLERVTNQADRGGWLGPGILADLHERHRGRNGIAAFRAATANLTPQTRRTQSDLEVAFLALCRKHGLPEPVMNAELLGFRVDAHFAGTQFVVELDSYDYHRTPVEFDRDRRRDAVLKLERYEVLRVSDAWLDADPAGVARTVRRLLQFQLIWLPDAARIDAGAPG